MLFYIKSIGIQTRLRKAQEKGKKKRQEKGKKNAQEKGKKKTQKKGKKKKGSILFPDVNPLFIMQGSTHTLARAIKMCILGQQICISVIRKT